MLSEFYFEWESALILAFQSALGRAGAWIMSVISEFGGEVILFLILGFLYWGFDKELGEKVGVNLLASIVICPILKNRFLRLRPYFLIKDVDCLKPVADGDLFDVTIQGYSFPSNHSSSAASVYGTIALYSRKRPIRMLCAALIVAVGISRFCLGVHFPTDVIAGLLIGAAVIMATEIVLRKSISRKALYTAVIFLGAVGIPFCTTEDYFTAYGVLAGGLAGLLYEHRYVGFTNTDSFVKALVRTVGGIAVFLGVNYVLKLLFALPADSGKTTMLLRSVRYAVSAFASIGIYPYVFRQERDMTISET